MRVHELQEDISRRDLIKGAGAAAAGLAGADAFAKTKPKHDHKPVKDRPLPPAEVSQKVAAKGTETQQPMMQADIYNELKSAAQRKGIRDPIELAQLLSQASAETGHFKYLGELGNTKKYRHTQGNRGVHDAEAFKGRGYFQLTGRSNYAAVSRKLYGDPNVLLDDPATAANPAVAADIAILFWNDVIKSRVSNFADTASVTKLINGLHAKPETIKYRDKLFRELFLPALRGQKVAQTGAPTKTLEEELDELGYDTAEILRTQDARGATDYALKTKRRWPAAERFIINDLREAIRYRALMNSWPIFDQRLDYVKAQFPDQYRKLVNEYARAYSRRAFNSIRDGDVGRKTRNIATNVTGSLRAILDNDFMNLGSAAISADIIETYLRPGTHSLMDKDSFCDDLDAWDNISAWCERTGTLAFIRRYLEEADGTEEMNLYNELEGQARDLLTETAYDLFFELYRMSGK